MQFQYSVHRVSCTHKLASRHDAQRSTFWEGAEDYMQDPAVISVPDSISIRADSIMTMLPVSS